MKPRELILGVDTSNYTTSIALYEIDGLVTQKRQLLSVKPGERGLRQSEALFQHTVALPKLTEELFAEQNTPFVLRAVGCSVKPRNLDGSYMPCFLAGESTARSIAASHGIPFYPFSHQSGHIMAAAYGSGDLSILDKPFLAFHVSGGTTDLLSITPDKSDFTITEIGTSLDLHAGQLIDRIGIMLGLSFPCGPALEQLAAAYVGETLKPRVSLEGCSCHLSGGENQAQTLLRDGKTPEEIAAFTFAFLERSIAAMVQKALQTTGDIPVLFAGGVMSNHLMRASLSRVCDAHFTDGTFAADNAAGTALLCARKWCAGENT